MMLCVHNNIVILYPFLGTEEQCNDSHLHSPACATYSIILNYSMGCLFILWVIANFSLQEPVASQFQLIAVLVIALENNCSVYASIYWSIVGSLFAIS